MIQHSHTSLVSVCATVVSAHNPTSKISVCGTVVTVHTVQQAKYHIVAVQIPLYMSENLATMVTENFLSLLLDDKFYFQRQ